MRDFKRDMGFDSDTRYFPSSVEDIDRDINELKQARQDMIYRGTSKPLDPKDEQLISLAHEAGQMTVLAREESKRANKNEKDMKELVTALSEEKQRKINALNDRDVWRERAETAEKKLERLKPKKVAKKKVTKK